MKALILLITLKIILFILPSAYAGQGSLQASRPNIIFIFTDDLGYGDIESFGAVNIKTPSIDRMGSEGMKFAEFYSASPVCSPSRAGLLTGRYPIRMGINFVFFPESYGGLPPGEVTIAEVLRDAGYTTGIVG
ncbi:MAG: sulfatase-like hydrolase/transferase, partial [Deltaproteobacteria bacterium]|nr:sulfatase-like hydrolase/transferase [Deltaproteobacteria bacterium]